MLRSCRTRRSRATTSCEVGPDGLSTISRPSIDRVLNLRDEQLLQRVDRARHRAPRRVLVSAAAEGFGHAADVDVALGSHADAILLPFGLLEEDHRLDL